MKTDAHRLERLRLWLGDFDGSLAAFCRHYGLPKSRARFLSQVLTGHRSLGEKAARRLESECGRPMGWLDEEAEADQPIRYDASRVAQMPADGRALIEDFIAFVLDRSEARRNTVTKATRSLTVETVTSPPPAVRDSLRLASRRQITRGTLDEHAKPLHKKKQRGAA